MHLANASAVLATALACTRLTNPLRAGVPGPRAGSQAGALRGPRRPACKAWSNLPLRRPAKNNLAEIAGRASRRRGR
eukprot:3446515-Alexandrium_andersonii.AAC.1